MKTEKHHQNFPLVSVVMPVFNRENFIGEAIRSVLHQTYRNFELIVVNDGSTDRSIEIIKNLQNEDKRIIIIEQPNGGIVSARNRGCSYAKGDYIAILDSDDIAMETRFEKQVDFLERNVDVGICGSWVRTIEKNSKIFKYPCDDDKIKVSLLFTCPFAHSSVMVRKGAIPFFPTPYTESYDTAEDYDLWVKCMNFTKYSNMDDPLVLYRIHPDNASTLMNEKNRELAKSIRNRLIASLNIQPTENEIAIHDALCNGCYSEIGDIKAAYSWLNKIIISNKQQMLFLDDLLINKINHVLVSFYCSKFRSSGGIGLVRTIWGLPFFEGESRNFIQTGYFKMILVGCIIMRRLRIPVRGNWG